MAEKLSRVSLGKSFLDLLTGLSFVPLERALGRMKDWKPDSKNNRRWQIFCLRRKLMLDGEERRAVDFLWELQKQCRVLGRSGLCHRLVGNPELDGTLDLGFLFCVMEIKVASTSRDMEW